MEEMSQNKGREDVERQFQIIREDITTLSKLLREIGEEKAAKSGMSLWPKQRSFLKNPDLQLTRAGSRQRGKVID